MIYIKAHVCIISSVRGKSFVTISGNFSLRNKNKFLFHRYYLGIYKTFFFYRSNDVNLNAKKRCYHKNIGV